VFITHIIFQGGDPRARRNSIQLFGGGGLTGKSIRPPRRSVQFGAIKMPRLIMM
jgi:hypothetical protein